MEQAAKSAFQWLRRNEWEWAESYLQERIPNLGFSGVLIPRRRSSGYNGTVELIMCLEQGAAGLKLIERLKNALRQRRYRSPSNGKQACTFSLSNSTVEKLRRQAGNQPKTLIVAELIDGLNSTSKAQLMQIKQFQETVQIERKTAKQTNAMLKRQLDEVMNRLERHVELLVMWETSMKATQPPFDGDETDARREVEKRMKGIKRSLNVIAFEHDVSSERLV